MLPREPAAPRLHRVEPAPPASHDSREARLRRLFDGRGILFGADYNPEQWGEDVWRDDVRLMRRAGLGLVTIGVFSWARIEPEPGARDWGWLDAVLALLHEAGIGVDLATPTASPPPWLGHRHPDTLPVDAEGVRLSWGSRNQFCPTSSVYAGYADALARDLAERYGSHPALRLWHIGNEYGPVCHCDSCGVEFRSWLRRRHGDLAGVNRAWGTTFWSQHYSDWDEITPPRPAPYLLNPAHVLDFRRFTSDSLLRRFSHEAEVVRAAAPGIAVTTNAMGFNEHIDLWSWAPAQDIVSNDHYADPEDPRSAVLAALTHDLVRSAGGGRPWISMEQAPSAVNWRDHNPPKEPGQLRLDSLQAVARGADGSCFFQWRASRFGAERFHSALVPHAGERSRLFEEAAEHGRELAALAPVAGAAVPADVAIVYSWESRWAVEQPAVPSGRLSVLDQVTRWYRVLWDRNITCDLVPPDADLSRYRLVLAPSLFQVTAAQAAGFQRFVEAGGTFVLGPFSGVADQNNQVWLDGYPGPLRALMGARVQEVAPLHTGTVLSCAGTDGSAFAADLWSEVIELDGAEALAHAVVQGERRPIVTMHHIGRGTAMYLGVRPDDDGLAAILGRAIAAAAVRPPPLTAPLGVEVVRRGDVVFALNHLTETVTIPLSGRVDDLLSGSAADHLTLQPRQVAALLMPVPDDGASRPMSSPAGLAR